MPLTNSRELQEIARKSKKARQNQQNYTHTAGTVSFAMAHRALELKEGRPVGRVELFFHTHLDKEGCPVNDYSHQKMVCHLMYAFPGVCQ